MREMDTLFTGIQYKLKKMAERYQILKAENQQHYIEIQTLKTINEQQKETIKQLEEKIKLLKITKALEQKEGSVEAKLKINELLREIEKCIRLINT
ncbi:MAG TPA: hypothetical protein PKN12_01610 [Bacteroidales bacterium]|nr:hypothetical protein [Bacteroidales bacterium]HPT08977.1 hypothetical protein [Bacteroidales bacterium]